MLIDSWKNNDRVVIERLIADLNSGRENADELRTSLGADYQPTLVEGIRRSVPQNPVLSALVELLTSHILNAGRPRKPKGFSDLVGNWRWDDYFYASRDAYTREQKGIWVMLDLVRKRAEMA